MCPKKKKKSPQINPIDKDKITENPHSIAYPHQLGSVSFEPTKMGVVKRNAYSAMAAQTQMQLNQIYKQMELLASQAKQIKQRMEISDFIYQSSYSFTPLIGHLYHLYQKDNSEYTLSLIGPEEWKKKKPLGAFKASVRLLSDQTWQVEKGHLD